MNALFQKLQKIQKKRREGFKTFAAFFHLPDNAAKRSRAVAFGRFSFFAFLTDSLIFARSSFE